MNLFEAAWVIARRDFTATVYSRSFILFLAAPLLLLAFVLFFNDMAESADQVLSQPVVALVADSETARAIAASRTRLVGATSELSFPILRQVAPAENVAVQARALLADEEGGYSAVLSGTLERPTLTAPERMADYVGSRIGLIVDEARRTAALDAAGAQARGEPIIRDRVGQAAGTLQANRRAIARGGQGLVFTVTLMLATLLLSNLVEEKSNKVIEVLAAAVPLDAVFLGKLMAMLGISLVGLTVWGGTLAVGYTFLQILQDWVALPQVAPAIGWPIWIVLLLLYFAANFLLLGALFLAIGGQASNIREIQTISMPVTLLQLMVLLLAMKVVGGSYGPAAWVAFVVPFSSPLAMIALAAESPTLWPHLVALAWQAVWLVLIIRVASRMFRLTVLKSGSSGSFFNLGFLRRGSAG